MTLNQESLLLMQMQIPVLSSHPREAQKLATYGRWLHSGGEYQYKIKVWEKSLWLLRTGWLFNKGDR